MINFNKQWIFCAVTTALIILLCGFTFYNSKNNTTHTNIEETSVTESFSVEESSSNDNFSVTEINTEEITTVSEEFTTVHYNKDSGTPDNSQMTVKYSEEEYKELINFDAKFPYLIKVNRAQNWVTVFGLDNKGRYSVPYKIFICSTGLNKEDTPLGTFKISDKYEWRMMVDGSYAQYATRINGPIMLHSVPYYSTKKNDLEVEEYAKLGSPASLGCIRLNVESIKWIYDNCPKGSTVVVYESETERPLLELPKLKKAKSKGAKAGWDPTDPDKNNPWNNK